MYPQRRPESGNFRARKQGRLLSAWALEPRYLPASTLPAPLTDPSVDRSAFVEQLGEQFGTSTDFSQFDLSAIAEQALGAAWSTQPQREVAKDQGLLPLNTSSGIEIYLSEPEQGGETLLSSIPWMPVADKLVLNGTLSEKDRSDIYALQVGSNQEPIRIVLAPIDANGNVPALTVWDSSGKPIYHWTSTESKVPLDVQFSLPASLADSLKDSPWVYVGVTLPSDSGDGSEDDSGSSMPDDTGYSPPPAMPGGDPGSDSHSSKYSLTVERGSGSGQPAGPTSGYGGGNGGTHQGQGSGDDSRQSTSGRIGHSDSAEAPGILSEPGGGDDASQAADDSESAANSAPGSDSEGLDFVPSGSARQLTGSGLGVDPAGGAGLGINPTDNLEVATLNLDNLPPEVLAEILANRADEFAFRELPMSGSLIGPLTSPELVAGAVPTSVGPHGEQLTAGPLNDPLFLSYAIAALNPSQDLGEGDLALERPSRLVTLGLPSLGFAAALAYGFFYPTAGRAARPRRVQRSPESVAPGCTPIEPR